MSDEFATGQASLEEAQGFTELAPDPRTPQPPEDDKPEYSSDDRDLRQAARDLVKERGPSEAEVTERNYIELGGKNDGEIADAKKTVPITRATDDLKSIRNFELEQKLARDAELLTQAVDEIRSGQIGPDLSEHLEALKAANEANLEEYRQNVEALDEDVQKMLQHPKLVKAVQQELAQAEQAKQTHIAQAEAARAQYQEAARQAAQVSMATAIASFPELSGLDGTQIQTALQVIQQRDPQRAQAIVNHLQHVVQLHNVSEQARAQQSQIEQQKVQSWMEAEEQKFSQWAAKPENSARVKAVQADALNLFQSEYGVSKAELKSIFESVPAFRSDLAQRLITDALSYRQAMRGAARAAPKPVPLVQRPGTSSYRSSDSGVEAARQSFMKSPDIKSAVALLRARRSAAS